MQIPGAQPRYTEPESLGLESWNLHFKQGGSGWFYLLKFSIRSSFKI